jgi:hypothetical protein
MDARVVDAGPPPEVEALCDAVLACDPTRDYAECLANGRSAIDRIRTSGAALCETLARARLDLATCLAGLDCTLLVDPNLDQGLACPAASADVLNALRAGAAPCLEGGPPVDAPAGWVCAPGKIGDGLCDCGCGVLDPDCGAAEGCETLGCRAPECDTCFENGRSAYCFDFCGECNVDADCPLGVCVPDPDGPGVGYCTAPCEDLASCGPTDDPLAFCGTDGNCLTTTVDVEACAGDLMRGGVTDVCGNFVAPRVCDAGTHCELLDSGVTRSADCITDYPDGTPTTDERHCQGRMTRVFAVEPDLAWCTSPCMSDAECDPGTWCSSGVCAPLLFYYCGETPTQRRVRDLFGVDYPAMATTCAAGSNCVDATTSTGDATCVPLLGDGQTCTTGAQCVGGICRSTTDAPTVLFCSRSCAANPCPSTMTCSGGSCVPIRRESCSSDRRRRTMTDYFGRTYSTLQTCDFDQRCSYSGSATYCRELCNRPSGCSCYGGFCVCCGPETYNSVTNQCCQTCDNEYECRGAY